MREAARADACDLVAETTRVDRERIAELEATAVFGGAVKESQSPWFVGPFGWVLEDVRLFDDPHPGRGAQGLWECE